MLLSSVIIVLRETLEAALLLSLLLAFSCFAGISLRWSKWALVCGLLGGGFYAFFIDPISNSLDGVGQEVFNAFLQSSIALLILALTFCTGRSKVTGKILAAPAPVFMALIVALAVSREGAEIIIYLWGLVSHPNLALSVSIGSILGFGIGLSLGVLIFFGLTWLEKNHGYYTVILLLALMAANMVSQSIGLLAQADWIPTTEPLWNTSRLLSESSTLGQLLYALIGYEATPSAIQITGYGSTFIVTLASGIFGLRKHINHHE
jgi:high-affinity iron transporter